MLGAGTELLLDIAEGGLNTIAARAKSHLIRLPILCLACYQHGQSDVAIARVNSFDQPPGLSSWSTEPSGESTIYRMSAKPSAFLFVLLMC